MLEEKDMKWFEERELLEPELVQFEEVRYANGDVEITGDQLSKLLHYECAIGLVVDGKLTVSGHLSIGEQHAVFVSGTVKCDSFAIYASPFAAEALEVKNVLFFGESSDQMIETWDCPVVRAKVAMVMEAGDLGDEMQFQHVIERTEEYADVLQSMLEDNFEVVYAALVEAVSNGTAINDEWISQNGDLCTDAIIKKKYLG